MSDVVQKFWGFCHTLRHDGIDYGDYIEQITYLLFLKMADERAIDLSRMGVPQDAAAAIDCSWPALASEQGEVLTDHYNGVLRTLGRQPGLLGDIFTGAVSRFNNPANLKRLIDLIDETEWTALEVDLKAAVFEGLLEKAASEGKKGAGPVLHAAAADPVDRALRAARSARQPGVHDLRSGLRHRRASWSSPTNGCWPSRARTAREPELARRVRARHLLRPGAGGRARGAWR